MTFHVARRICLMWCDVMSGIVVVVVVGAMVGRRGFEERGMGAIMRGNVVLMERCILRGWMQWVW